jgi:hypothetical protein
MSWRADLPVSAWIFLALAGLVLVWDLVTSGRIARLRSTPLPLGALSAVSGLLLMPALVVHLVTTSVLTGRALYTIAWVWPLATLLIAAQAWSAVRRGLAAPLIGGAILGYDIVLAAVECVRYLLFVGVQLPMPLVALTAADAYALARVAAPWVLTAPQFLFLPIVAPATPGRRGAGTVLRSAVAVVAALWGTAIVLFLPVGALAVRSYGRYADERLQERPDSDFAVGLKIFPSLDAGPPPLSLRTDLELADSLSANALSVYVTPKASNNLALDSLQSSLQDARAGRKLIVALDLGSDVLLPTRATRQRHLRTRVADAERIVRRLAPDVFVPVVDPNGAASRALGGVTVELWQGYIRDVAVAVHQAAPTVKVMVHVGGTSARDSALYAWAASPDAPVDGVAVSVLPGLSGAAALDARMRTLDDWLRVTPTPKEHWVLEAGGFPLVHGELSQERALWGVLAWATSRSAIRGLVIFEASDYGAQLGLRAPGGRVRRVAAAAQRAIRALGRK